MTSQDATSTTSIPPSTTWTDARIDLMRKLHLDGRSASQIAAELGGGVSRNAVMGKLYRLGLTAPAVIMAACATPAGVIPPIASARSNRMSRRSTVKIEAAQPAPIAAPLAPEPEPSPPIDPAPPQRFACLGDALLALPQGPRCRWPMEIDDPADVRFCGDRATEGSHSRVPQLIYCAPHAQRSRRSGAPSERQPLRSIPAHP